MGKSSGITSGHGIFSQYRPEHIKQWIFGEGRNAKPQNQKTKSLKELKSLVSSTSSETERASYKRVPDAGDVLASTSRPGNASEGNNLWDMNVRNSFSKDEKQSSHPPHLIHHHHFGWQPSQNDQQRLVGTLSNRESYHKYGDALNYCQQIHTKSFLINTRRS